MATQTTTPIGNLIRRALQERGWVAEDLAWRSEVRTATIYRMLSGDRDNPTLETIEKLAAGLGMTLVQFIAAYTEERARLEAGERQRLLDGDEQSDQRQEWRRVTDGHNASDANKVYQAV